jgi:hypothetical protein
MVVKANTAESHRLLAVALRAAADRMKEPMNRFAARLVADSHDQSAKELDSTEASPKDAKSAG